MPDYWLTQAADEDLISIEQFGYEKFGVEQSNRYREKLKHHFSLLAEWPELYPAVDHLHPGYRRSVCGSHSIFYRILGEDVEIVRILNRQNLEEAF